MGSCFGVSTHGAATDEAHSATVPAASVTARRASPCAPRTIRTPMELSVRCMPGPMCGATTTSTSWSRRLSGEGDGTRARAHPGRWAVWRRGYQNEAVQGAAPVRS